MCYIVQKIVINSEQIQFQKRGVEVKGPLSQAHAFISLRVGVLNAAFVIGLTHASDFGIRAGMTLTVRF